MKNLLLIFLFTLFSLNLFSCDGSSISTTSGPTDIGGGQWSVTISFCTSSGSCVNSHTANFSFGVNGATFVSYPTSLTSPFIPAATYTASAPIASGGYTSWLNYPHNGTYWSMYATSGCTTICIPITFVFNGYPNEITVIGLEGNTGTGCAGETITFPVLPIELKEFYGHNKEGVNKLYWTTLTEINNEYFTLERSRDAINWDYIGTVQGNGNSRTSIMYEFNDDSYDNGTNYYRLTQTDFDGKFETFETVLITTPNVKFLDYKVVNLLGQEIIDDINQHRIIIWSDNAIKFIPAGYRTAKRTK